MDLLSWGKSGGRCFQISGAPVVLGYPQMPGLWGRLANLESGRAVKEVLREPKR